MSSTIESSAPIRSAAEIVRDEMGAYIQRKVEDHWKMAGYVGATLRQDHIELARAWENAGAAWGLPPSPTTHLAVVELRGRWFARPNGPGSDVGPFASAAEAFGWLTGEGR